MGALPNYPRQAPANVVHMGAMIVDYGFDDFVETARSLLAGYESLDQLWDANDAVNAALSLRLDSSRAWLLKSQIMSALGDDLAALAAVERARQLQPNDPEAEYVRGAVLADMERFDDALVAIEQAATEIDVERSWLEEDLVYEKANILEAMGRSNDALQILEHGLSDHPDSFLLRSGIEPLRRKKLRDHLRVIDGGLSASC